MRIIGATLLLGLTGAARAQSAADGPVLGARHVLSSAAFKVWVPDGEIRMIAWDRDSLLIRGRIARGDNFFIGGDPRGMKFGVEHPGTDGSGGKSTIVVYLPRGARVSVKLV